MKVLNWLWTNDSDWKPQCSYHLRKQCLSPVKAMVLEGMVQIVLYSIPNWDS